jgi:hypothetical protein
MIKLTEFTSVVDTYKKNFDIRSKRFSDKKKKDTKEKIEKRENRIETKKFFSSVGAKVAEKIKPGGNILDTVIRFAGFTLLGVLVKNLDKVAAFAKQVIEKVKEFAIRFKKYFDDVLVPLFNDIVGLGTQIKDTFGDIANFVIRMNPYNELSDVLETVMSGILALGYRIASLYRPFTTPTTPGATPPATKAPVKTPARTPAKTPVIKRVFKPSRFKVRAAERAKVAERAVTKRLSETKVTAGVGAGKGAPGRGGMPFDDINKAIDDVLKGKDPKIKITKKQYTKPVGPKQFIPDTPTQLLGRAIGSDIANLIKTYKKLGLSNSDLLKIANDIDGESFNERKAAYEILKKKGLADRVFNVPDASQAFPKPVNRTSEGILRGPGFRAPTIPPAQQPLTILQKLQRTFDVNAKRLQTLTKGLDFRFDAGKVLKEQLLSPKNFLKNLGSFGIGVGLDVGAKLLGKYISSILPYNEDFELLGYLGMIDPDRIHQLTAGKIIDLPDDKRREAIKRLEKDSKSSDDIFGTGQKKREMANAILKYISIFSGGEFGSLEKSKVPAINVPKSDQQIKPGMLVPGDYTPEELKQLEEIQKRFGSQSNVSKPSMVASVNRNISDGLDGPTTYGSQGMIKTREVVIAIQPVEVPA